MKAGDRVRVSNPQRGAVDAEVLDCVNLDDLPQVPTFDTTATAAVRTILEDGGITHIAWLTYEFQKKRVMFAALRTAAGWYDLKRQELTITPLPATQSALFDTAPRPR